MSGSSANPNPGDALGPEQRVSIYHDITVQIQPPKHLTECAKRAFSHHVSSRLPGDWSPSDLFILERLCQLSVLVDQYYRRIDTDVDDQGNDHNLSKFLSTWNAYLRGCKALYLVAIPPVKETIPSNLARRATGVNKMGVRPGDLDEDTDNESLG